MSPLDYPHSHSIDQVDDYHGTLVPTPIAGWKTPTLPKLGAGSKRKMS